MYFSLYFCICRCIWLLVFCKGQTGFLLHFNTQLLYTNLSNQLFAYFCILYFCICLWRKSDWLFAPVLVGTGRPVCLDLNSQLFYSQRTNGFALPGPPTNSFPQNQKQIEKYMELQAARRQILFLKIRNKLRNIWNCQARRQIFSSNQKQIEKYKEGMGKGKA